ncbi:MAG TPA: tetratricopeptide repeat protein [Myxococcota bacterium]|nr:tetratricopeptide repeat protein [Myxococcota bacterium]
MLLLALSASTSLAYDIKEELPTPRASQDSVYLNPGEVSIGGVVEVPLYDDADPSTVAPLVEVEAPDGSLHLFQLGLGDSSITLGESALKAFGGSEPKERAMGKAGVVQEVSSGVDFGLGDAQFTDVTVIVGSQPGGLGTSGILGLLAFEDLSVAILNSEGVVRLAPAAQGSDLSAAVDGAALPYSRVEGSYHKDGKIETHTTASSALLVGSLGDTPVAVRFSTASDQRTAVSAEVLADREPVWKRGELGVYSAELQLDGLKPIPLLVAETTSSSFSYEPYQVLLGADITAYWDMAFDSSAKTVTIATVGESKRSDWGETALSNAMEALEPPETEEGEEAPEIEASAYAGVSAVHAALGNDQEALDYAEQALEANEDEMCSSYQGVGDAHLALRDWEKAREYYVKTLEVYDPWGEMAPSKRAEILEEKAKVEEGYKLFDLIPIRRPGEWEGFMPQPHSCDQARATLLIAETILGNPDEAHRRWTEERDIEKSLGYYAALSYISQGRYEEALSAFQWSVGAGRLTYFDDAGAALGMALVQDRLGKRDQAMASYEQALWTAENDDLLTVRAYSMAVASREGRAAAAKHMAALADANATSGTWALVSAEALVAAGEDSQPTLDTAIARFEKELIVRPDNGELRGGYGAALVRAGRLDDARAQANRALEADPTAGLPQLVLGDLATLEGDGEAASVHYATAASAVYWHPMLAVFL